MTAAGTHTIEYWTMDIARNESAHVTKTFAVAAAPASVATKLTMNVSLTSLSLGHSAHFFGVIAPNMPNGTPISFLVRKAGQTKWTRAVPYARTYSAHHWSFYYHPSTRGTYYFKVKFAATAGAVILGAIAMVAIMAMRGVRRRRPHVDHGGS